MTQISNNQEFSADGSVAGCSEKISVALSLTSVVNYALKRNKFPIIKSLTVSNDSNNDLKNASLRIDCNSELCVPFEMQIDYIAPKSALEIKGVDLVLNTEYLAAVTEKVTTLLHITLSCSDVTLFESDTELTVLAFDEWHGAGYYPELLATFVTPNHPEITKIISRAAEYLKKWTGDPSLDAYQTKDPNRALNQAAAVFSAIKDLRVVYAVPPASFETVGQRIRLCDQIIEERIGTCLDLTLLYTSCLEAVGLHPIMILTRGHIFAGVWLNEMTFPEAIQDDISLVTKRTADGINEIAVVECTLVVDGKNATFDDARLAAQKQCNDINSIECIVDVARSRASGISPLPQRIRTDSGLKIEHQDAETGNTSAPNAIGTTYFENALESSPATKKAQWERKLLDLGLRNTLINMRIGKSTVPILTASIDDLEDALSNGHDFSIHSRPAEWTSSMSSVDFESVSNVSSCTRIITNEFKNNRLHSAFTEGELNQSLKNIYRAAKASVEENGANTLYLAMGILRWYETERSTKPRYAPLIMVPVEMIRKGASQGYVIRIRDDDPQFNITVLEKIKQDFGICVNGLDPLPEDESGIDTRKVLSTVRHAIMGQPKWDVLESAYLGIFSFSQFVMWNDIRNRADDLAKNKVVASLMEGRLTWDAEPMEIGERVSEDGVYLPIPADASQLYAIKSACGDESFVLHGPPGTGKSQTITALIANALANGKSVLFVAEKMAALEVVQKRLNGIGIGPFCLELHSNKSKKKDVLEQLRQVTEVTRDNPHEKYEIRADRIRALRIGLDSYAKKLHQKQSCGMSLYELVNGYEAFSFAREIKPISNETLRHYTSASLYDSETLLSRLVSAGKTVGHPCGHPLTPVKSCDYSQQIRHEVPQFTEEYRLALTKLKANADGFATAIGYSAPTTFDDFGRYVYLANGLANIAKLPKAWIKAEHIEYYATEIMRKMAIHFINAEALNANLSERWNSEFFRLDAKALMREYDSCCVKWFLAKNTGLKKMLKRLSAYMKTQIAPDVLGQDIADLISYQDEKSAGDELFSRYGADLEHLYNGAETDWRKVVELSDLLKLYSRRIRFAGSSDELCLNYAVNKNIVAHCNELLCAWSELFPAKDRLYTLLELDESRSLEWLDDQLDLCSKLMSHTDDLKDWMTWNSICREAIGLGLSEVVTEYTNGLEHDMVIPSYKKSAYRSLAMLAIEADAALDTFSGSDFNEKISQFKRIDAELTELTCKEIYYRLASKLPNFYREAAQSSEIGILQRAIRSGGRGTSIRKLFDQIPNLLPRLCPCMLMSPISAAQYLDPKRAAFDLVVFDEASQLPTCKAVGALARGKNAIIVGDPKQMPPTSFFASNMVDEDNLDLEDLESILDDCLALNMPQTHLLWHYRSRHESLIAFSNKHFYENKLYTFPSVNDRESKVTLVHVDGVFDRGRTRQNRAEAEAVVAEIKRRSHDENESQLSVGVVTFNISQQNLIDDLLSAECEKDSELEKWVYESAEPIFIKNLENVQGDERDVILFSIGYGPDSTGKVYMNFGPLNRDGGWRRLNVAVSRARCEMKVFSTLRADDINLSKTSAEGVSALKEFLLFAAGRSGQNNDGASVQKSICGEGVAETICEFLKEKGYETARMVGHSEYKIDIAVVDPKNPEKYLLGILLDGNCYGNSKTTRDRELAQINVLEGLGWEITRVWTMDWWDNKQKELNRILDEVKVVEEIGDNFLPEKSNDMQRISEPLQPTAPNSNRIAHSAIYESPEEPIQMYRIPNLETVYIDLAYISNNSDRVRAENLIKRILRAEAPISEGLLIKRCTQFTGAGRTGSRMQNQLIQYFRSMKIPYTIQQNGKIYWDFNQDPKSYSEFRATGSATSNKRDCKDVPIQEAANAVQRALREQFSLSTEDLIRESAKLMGYTRVGSNVADLFSEAIKYAKDTNKILAAENGNWLLK